MEEKGRRLPIGVQSFAKLRTGDFLYVDKTRYVYDLVHGSSQYFLSRPRRFGKSLFLSTLKAYWEGKKELFEGLEIEKLEKDNGEAFEPYPVFYFDFNGQNCQRETALEDVLAEHLAKWEKIYGGDDKLPLSGRFRSLIRAAAEKTGKGCVVLVDEYDKALLETLENNTLEEHNKAVFKGFFGTLKSYDEYLRFVFITGVTKFSKVSIFSDLNQLNDISLNEKYGGICGITEPELLATFGPEIKKLGEKNGTTSEGCLQELRKMYDGYHFAPQSPGVYNPFSLLMAFDNLDFGAYWFSTGTPSFLVRRLKNMQYDIKKFETGEIYATPFSITDYRAENPDILPLLYQTGYLTLQGYDARRKRYALKFPNEEVKYGLLEGLLPAYSPRAIQGRGADIFSLEDCLESGDTEGMRDILTALFASIPYTADDAPFEHYFQSVLYIVFTLLGQYVHCEVHSSRGRADCILETDKFVYIFEFKVGKSAREALEQIEAKGYAAPYAADKRQVFKIGVSFDGEERKLAEWEVRETIQ